MTVLSVCKIRDYIFVLKTLHAVERTFFYQLFFILSFFAYLDNNNEKISKNINDCHKTALTEASFHKST
jgi:hypothetical protein